MKREKILCPRNFGNHNQCSKNAGKGYDFRAYAYGDINTMDPWPALSNSTPGCFFMGAVKAVKGDSSHLHWR